MKTRLLTLTLLTAGIPAGTIYLCKSYSGGTFWAHAHCGKHNALIKSIVRLPHNMPFKQQAALAEQQPQSGAMQDWFRGERKKARDRQFDLRC